MGSMRNWYTIAELEDLAKQRGFDIKAHGIKGRIKNLAEHEEYQVLENCVFKNKATQKLKHNPKRQHSIKYYNWRNLIDQMPIGSLHKQAKALQAKFY